MSIGIYIGSIDSHRPVDSTLEQGGLSYKFIIRGEIFRLFLSQWWQFGGFMTLDDSCPNPTKGQSKEIKRKKDKHNLVLKVTHITKFPYCP